MKKYLIVGLILVILCGCQKQSDEITGEVVKSTLEIEQVTLTEDGSFSLEECKKRELNNKVLMLESKYCGHCKAALPVFNEACNEKGIIPLILDVSEDEQRKQMEKFGLNIMYTPTLVFGCDYYIGARQKQEYLQILDKFLND